MQLSNELVEKFRALHLEKYSEEITYGAAESQLKKLADLVRITSLKQESYQNA